MWKTIFFFIATGAVLASAPLAEAPENPCRPLLSTGDGLYPDHSLSPQESFRVHDTVFWAEVAVPARPCSLGTCAGLSILQVFKGQIESKVLVQVSQPEGSQCPASLFKQKNSRWVVFANTGTSRTGYGYFQVDDEGPTFASQRQPDFEMLEGSFRRMRARLDEAISERLGHLR